MGPKCGIFDATYGGAIFKIMLPVWAGSTFLKKYEKMKKNYAKSIKNLKKTTIIGKPTAKPMNTNENLRE